MKNDFGDFLNTFETSVDEPFTKIVYSTLPSLGAALQAAFKWFGDTAKTQFEQMLQSLTEIAKAVHAIISEMNSFMRGGHLNLDVAGSKNMQTSLKSKVVQYY
jgi:hypothetical protein